VLFDDDAVYQDALDVERIAADGRALRQREVQVAGEDPVVRVLERHRHLRLGDESEDAGLDVQRRQGEFLRLPCLFAFHLDHEDGFQGLRHGDIAEYQQQKRGKKSGHRISSLAGISPGLGCGMRTAVLPAAPHRRDYTPLLAHTVQRN